MAIQIGTVDGLVNISKTSIECFIKAIDSFSKGGVEVAKQNNLAIGAAFQRYTIPVYKGSADQFDFNSISTPVLTASGNEQSPAILTYCKKMGLLDCSDDGAIFQLTPIAQEVLNGNISVEEYAFIILSKQFCFKDKKPVKNALALLGEILEKSPLLSEKTITAFATQELQDISIKKTRFDIILNALQTAGLLGKVTSDSYVVSSLPASKVFLDILENQHNISLGIHDEADSYTEYIGSISNGIFDILNSSNLHIYDELFPHLKNYMNSQSANQLGVNHINIDEPHQQIFYGTPGTGKSHKIVELIKEYHIDDEHDVFRTTFHPDSDYSTFVGCYKPTLAPKPVRDLTGKIVKVGDKDDAQEVMEDAITYRFVPQAFLKAYIRAYNEPKRNIILVIEEINRGNCAQIFGDLFQLLDRENNVSKYPIKADEDLRKFLMTAQDENGEDILTNKNGIANGELRLPQNLYIWATMNTSDQSLFPIDSAFKRRWVWKYMKIVEPIDKKTGEKFNLQIEANGKQFSWWKFLQKINKEIGDATSSEDKKLGYFFATSDSHTIDAELFVSKVLFYIYGDALKDDTVPFKVINEDGKQKTAEFSDFFDGNGDVDEQKVCEMLEKYLHEQTDEDETAEE